eukprot:scaffold15594_cov63-Phaeocystis_antarctica.AAC.4
MVAVVSAGGWGSGAASGRPCNARATSLAAERPSVESTRSKPTPATNAALAGSNALASVDGSAPLADATSKRSRGAAAAATAQHSSCRTTAAAAPDARACTAKASGSKPGWEAACAMRPRPATAATAAAALPPLCS